MNDLTTLVHEEGFRAGRRTVTQRTQAQSSTQTQPPPDPPNPTPDLESKGTMACLQSMRVLQPLNLTHLLILVSLISFLAVLTFYYNPRSQPVVSGDSDVYFEGLS